MASRLSGRILAALAALVLAVSVAVRAQTPAPPAAAWKAPPAPVQPLPYSHRYHVRLGLDCRDCHTNPDAGRLMTFPPTAVCMTCHADIPADREPLRQLAAYAASGAPIPWVRVYRVADYVYWQHATHLDATITCAECHGPVGEREVVAQETNIITMAGCLSCHEKKKVLVDCGDCHEPRQ